MFRRSSILATACIGVALLVLLGSHCLTVPSVGRGQAPDGREDESSPGLAAPLAADVTLAREPVTSSEGSGAGLQPEEARLTGGDATLIVLLVDEPTGTPVSGARVLASKPSESFSKVVVDRSVGTMDTVLTTGEEGRAEFRLPSGSEFQVSVQGDKKVKRVTRAVEALSPGEQRTLSLTVPRSEPLTYFGRVLSAEDRSPVYGARVELIGGGRSTRGGGEERTENIVDMETTTEADGLFELSAPSWKICEVRIQAAGFGPVLLQVESGHERSEAAQIVSLHRMATLRARVQTPLGEIVSTNRIRLHAAASSLVQSDHEGPHFSLSHAMSWEGGVDATGLCVIEGLPPRVPLQVEILVHGLVVRRDLPPLSLKPGEVREVDWRLGSGCRLTGSAVDQDGRPASSLGILLQPASDDSPAFFEDGVVADSPRRTETDAQGRFVFLDVGAGRWRVGPAPGTDCAPYAEMIEIPDGEARHETSMRVYRGLYICGSVLGPTGGPVSGASISAVSETGAGVYVQCNSDGAFVLGPLVPGPYWLSAGAPRLVDSAGVAARPGDVGVVLRLQAGGRIEGAVLDGISGRPCSATLTYWRVGALGCGVTYSRDGTFHLEGLEAGAYCLAARGPGGRVGVLRDILVAPGRDSSGVTLDLVPGSRLRIVNQTAEDNMYRVSFDGAVIAMEDLAASDETSLVVPPGRIAVEFLFMPSETAQEVEVAEGEEARVVFEDGQ